MGAAKKTTSKTKVVASKKRSISKKTLAIVATLAVLVVAAVSFLVYSSQQKNDANAVGAATCGSGYSKSNEIALYKNGDGGSTKGPGKLVVYKHYTSSTKRCYLLIATGGAYGVIKPMKVSVYNKTYPTKPTLIATDSGNFRYYAGPIYSNKVNYTFANAFMTYKGIKYSTGIHIKY